MANADLSQEDLVARVETGGRHATGWQGDLIASTVGMTILAITVYRALGLPLVIVASVFVAYVFFGHSDNRQRRLSDSLRLVSLWLSKMDSRKLRSLYLGRLTLEPSEHRLITIVMNRSESPIFSKTPIEYIKEVFYIPALLLLVLVMLLQKRRKRKEDENLTLTPSDSIA